MTNKIAVFVPESFPSATVDGKRAIPFRPTSAQIQVVEKNLAQLLKSKHPALYAKYEHYFRQYTGLNLEKGAEIIRGNFMCQVDNEAWKKEWVFMEDGGDCYFNFTYDLVKSEITEFSINGDI